MSLKELHRATANTLSTPLFQPVFRKADRALSLLQAISSPDISESLKKLAEAVHSGQSLSSAFKGLHPSELREITQDVGEGTLREILSLSGEDKAGLFWSSALRLGLQLKKKQRADQAIAVFSLVAERSEIPSLASKARAEKQAIEGDGAIGGRAEYMLSRFIQDASDAKMIAPMMGASLLSQAVGFVGLSQLAKVAPAWYSRGIGARALTGAAAFSAEAIGFSLAGRALHSQAPAPLSQDLQRSALTLGLLRAFSLAGQQAALGLRHLAPATASTRSFSSLVLPQAAAFLGLYSAHRLEMKWGLRPVVPDDNAFVDSLSSLFALGIGSQLGSLALGSRFTAAQSALTLRMKSHGQNGAPFFPLKSQEALATAGTSKNLSPRADESTSAPLMMSSGFSEKKMTNSYNIAAGIIRATAPSATKAALANVQQGDLLVVEGDFDRIEVVLNTLRVPYKIVPPKQITPESLVAAKCVFVNCSRYFPPLSAQSLSQWVETGGLLMTTDWALENILATAFRDAQGRPYIQHNGQLTGNKNPAGGSKPEWVGVSEYKRDEPGIAGYWGNTEPQWWLEPSSYPIQINRKDIEVLAQSDELGHRYGAKPVVVRFQHGQGGVVHMISHFFLQNGGPKAGKVDQTASAYVTSLGLPSGIASKVARLESDGASESTILAATASLAFLTNTITQASSERPWPSRLIASDTKASPSHVNLVWKGQGPLWRYEKGWVLTMPLGKGAVTVGRNAEALIYDTRRSSDISRDHAEIRRYAPVGSFIIRALDGNVTVIRGDQEPISLKRKQDEWTYLLPGDLVRLTPQVEFLFKPD